MPVLPIPVIVERITRFYYIHGHTDVPISYKIDEDLAKAVRQLKLMRRDKHPQRIAFVAALQDVLPGVPFGERPRARQYLTSRPPNLKDFFSDDTTMYKLVMWFATRMWDLYTIESPDNKASNEGLKKFQGVDRGMFAQYIFRGDTDKNRMVAGTWEDQGQTRKHGANFWRGRILRQDCLFFSRIFCATEQMVKTHVGFDVGLHTALFLGKCHLDSQNAFHKHIDDHDNKMAGFVGAVSLVIADSKTHSRPGGVVVFPDCCKRNHYCKAKVDNTCTHQSVEIRLETFESVFVPENMFHKSLYPEGGTQFNLVMFLVRSDGDRTRGKNRSQEYKIFTKAEFQENWFVFMKNGVQK